MIRWMEEPPPVRRYAGTAPRRAPGSYGAPQALQPDREAQLEVVAGPPVVAEDTRDPVESLEQGVEVDLEGARGPAQVSVVGEVGVQRGDQIGRPPAVVVEERADGIGEEPVEFVLAVDVEGERVEGEPVRRGAEFRGPEVPGEGHAAGRARERPRPVVSRDAVAD